MFDTDKSNETSWSDWSIEGFVDERNIIRRIPLRPLPFQVGRNPEMHLVLPFSNISKHHAEIYRDNDDLMVRDLGSTNGTYVNGDLVSGTLKLQHDDIVSFANLEFRMVCESMARAEVMTATTSYDSSIPVGALAKAAAFQKLMHSGSVVAFFQPLVRFSDRGRFGYELLGRGSQAGLSPWPRELFDIACGLGNEIALSQLFRLKGAEACHVLPPEAILFVNVHASEMREPKQLLQSFGRVREVCPERGICMEIHESVVTNVEQMRALRTELARMQVQLAYDDFGAGQARLLELVEVTPDFLKFDSSLVHHLYEAPANRQRMVEMLVKFADNQGVQTVAEGIELEQDAEICRQMGFYAGQGFFLGRPQMADPPTAG